MNQEAIVRQMKRFRDKMAMEREVSLTKSNTLYLQILQLAARRLDQAQQEIREMVDIFTANDGQIQSNPISQQFFEMNDAVITAIRAVFPDGTEPTSVFGTDAQTRAIGAILEERKNQDTKWEYVTHDGPDWLSILMEEVGEMCQDINQGNDYKEELIQIAAVAQRWLEAIECGVTQSKGDEI